MKKFLMIVLSIICLFSFTMAVACDSENNNNNNVPQASDTTLMRGFNNWNELAVFDLNPTTFEGNWSVNIDPQYLVEGEGSWKIYFNNRKVNQPSFKMRAQSIKTDITDVVEFNMWVYSDADYSFSIIITAFAGDEVVCAPIAQIQKGANNLVFPINRALISQSGKVISDYSISFSGVKANTTLYIDNFVAKTTTEEVKIKPEVQEVIDAINAFSLNPEREVIEAVMAKYNALSADDRLCVTNSKRLKTVIEPYYLSDLAKAQAERPNILLYYDSQFGEVQVDSITSGISGYAYTTERKYGEQAGSLRVDFTLSSTYWVTLTTTATTMIDEELIKFYVYNDSNQYKAMCVGWNAPEDELVKQPLYVIEPNTWFEISCPSSWLYDAGGASGGIQMCGLTSMDINDLAFAASESPVGSMYFSAFEKIDTQSGGESEGDDNSPEAIAVKEARTGEDENTLWFFDRELGLTQIANSEGEVKLTDQVKYDGESTVALTIGGKAENKSTKLKNFGYEFNEGDIVAFYIKADITADYLRVRLANKNATMVHSNVWTLIMFPASEFASYDWLWLEGFNDGGNYVGNSGSTIDGTIYFAKAKVYSSSQAVNLTTVDSTYEYKIGQVDFVNKAYEFKKGTYNYDPNAFNSDWYNYPYLIDGQLVVTAKSDNADNKDGVTRDTAIGFELKEAISTAGKKIYILATGLVDPHLQIMTGRESGHFATPHGKAISTDENGYTLWEIDLSVYNNECKYFRFWFGQEKIIPDVEQVVIKDFYIVG